MKLLSPWLAVLLLTGVPLTAAAFDYGPNQPLLAADTGAPQVPGLQAHSDAGGAMVKPDVMPATDRDTAETGNPTPVPQALPPLATTSPRPGPAPRNLGPSAAAHRSQTRLASPQPAPTASWQSLLPGSIQ